VQLLFDLLSSCSGLVKHNAATTPAAVTVPTLRLRPRAAIERVPRLDSARPPGTAWGSPLRFADGYSFGDQAISGGIIASNRQPELSSAEPNASGRSDKDGQPR
jgi:hypothetical protein